MKYDYLYSVITVCYNAASSIEKTVVSVLKQDYVGYEYIIIDGASKDNTISKIKKYESSFDGRLRIISEVDRGIYDAMNKAINMSKGKYLIFINADDELCLNILSIIKNKIDEQIKLPDIVYGDSIVVYKTDEKQITKLRKAYSKITPKTLCRGMGVVHQSMFTKRDVFDRVGMFNIEYSIGADWNFLIKSVLSGVSMLYVEQPISIFATDGVSAKVHNLERHKIRKDNKLYKFIDMNLVRDVLNIGTMLQLIIGEKNYKKLKYFVNRLKR